MSDSCGCVRLVQQAWRRCLSNDELGEFGHDLGSDTCSSISLRMMLALVAIELRHFPQYFVFLTSALVDDVTLQSTLVADAQHRSKIWVKRSGVGTYSLSLLYSF